jgi:nucleoside-diphosphate-sugar epimerase
MKVAIAGANGFLGGSLARKFLQTGAEVWAFCNERSDQLPAGCVCVSGRNWTGLDHCFDVLIISIGSHAGTHKTFIAQQQTILEFTASARFKRIVYVSSVAVYGNHTDQIGIRSAYQTPGIYGLSKLSNEFIISGLESYAIIRPTYIYGKGMSPNSLIPVWVNHALHKGLIEVYGDGSREQDYLHIDDVTDLIHSDSLSAQNLTLIAATGTTTTNRGLAETIRQYSGRNVTITYAGTDNAPSFSYDVGETKAKLNWEPKIGMPEGLREYIEYARACL